MKDDEQKKRQKQRLQAALRQNLKRRKSQARARAAEGPVGERTHDSAGIAPDKKTR
jgi:hypothetical protein